MMKAKLSVLIAMLFSISSFAAKKPNILLITVDDMNWNSVGIYNSTVSGTTPNIDKLATQGIKFDYAYVPLAMCTPSRQIMLSGNHSHETMTRGFTELERVGPALPDILKDNGYFIANLNKAQGIYEWDKMIKEDVTAMGRDIPIQKKLVGEIFDEAGKKPWFIMMNFNDPHRPFYHLEGDIMSEKYLSVKDQLSTASKVFTDEEVTVPGFLPDLPEVRHEMARYYTSVRRADDGVGAILELLKEEKLEDNTIVVFVSDHGISMPYSKLNCYQTSLRVPMIMRYPGVVEAGARNHKDIVSTIDLAPTLIDLIGLEVPRHMTGRSFKPLLEGKTQENRDYTVGYYYRNLRQDNLYPEFAIHTRDWVYIYNPWVIEKKQVHNSDYTHSATLAAMWAASDTVFSIKQRSEFHKYRIIEELYHVRQDPHSYNNLINSAEHASLVAEMRQLLVNWMEETNHPAKDLMKDPQNVALIKKYMAWEKENAQKQIKEIMHLKKTNKNAH